MFNFALYSARFLIDAAPLRVLLTSLPFLAYMAASAWIPSFVSVDELIYAAGPMVILLAWTLPLPSTQPSALSKRKRRR